MNPEKTCAMCGELKPLEAFHKQPTGKFGRHAYCADCANSIRRLSRPTTSTERGYEPERVKRWNLKGRYGLTPEDYEKMFLSQGGRCAICREVPARPCIDHNHDTGQVRGILCHFCNIRLPAIEDEKYRLPATAYLSRWAANDNRESQKEAA